MAERPKLTIKTRVPERDPYRRPVRAMTAPRPNPGHAGARDAPPSAAPLSAAPPSAAQPAPPPAPVRPPAPRPRPRTAAAVPALAPEGVRVSKLVTERGLASRREADEWIEAGYVRVGGRAVVLGQRVAPDALIDIDARARATQARLVTVLLHKPVGWVSGQPEDGHEPAVMLVKPAHRWSGDASRIDYHPSHLRHLAPAGRLDIDSTGLLVFTQDGRIAKLLVGDQTRAEKEYLVRVRHIRPGAFPEEGMARLRHGLELDGVALRPARVSWQNEEQLRIVLREGRKRQIRRMCELVGLEVLGLKRVRIGSVSLGALPAGQWRYLRDDERF